MFCGNKITFTPLQSHTFIRGYNVRISSCKGQREKTEEKVMIFPKTNRNHLGPNALENSPIFFTV